MLDSGTRLLGRVLPIGRNWRLLIVTMASVKLHRLDDHLPGRTDQAGGAAETVTAANKRIVANAMEAVGAASTSSS